MADNWRHQDNAYAFAYPLRGAILEMWMGTGKTRVAINLIYGRKHMKVLVVCPDKVIDVWPEEFQKHYPNGQAIIVPLKDKPIVERTAHAKAMMALAEASNRPCVLVINYESVWREPFASYVCREKFDLLVMDEIHRIKAPGGKTSRFLARLITPGSGRPGIPYRLGLTGTLMPHSPMDVYAQYRAVDPRIFGTSFNAFKHRYGEWGGFGGYQLQGIRNKEELNQKIFSIAYHVPKEVLDLPPVQHITRYCHLSPQAQKIYDDLAQHFVADVKNGTVTASNALTRLLRLQQATSGFLTLDDGSNQMIGQEKYDLMRETVMDTPEDEPWVIFCRFKIDLARVHDMAKELGRRSLEVSGSRNELAQWQAGEAPILAAQITAGKEGVNLTRARLCGYYSQGFSLGDYDQSLCRTHRPGQERDVVYYHWVARGTVDEVVMRALAEKKEVVDEIINIIQRGEQLHA